jgi:preprotein translocase subunit YajC
MESQIILAAAAPPPEPPSFGFMIMGMIPFFIIMYILFIKPQQRQQREREDLIKRLKAGDRVVTIGGLHGIITAVKDATVVLQIAEKTRITVNSSSIGEILQRSDKESEAAAGDKRK